MTLEEFCRRVGWTDVRTWKDAVGRVRAHNRAMLGDKADPPPDIEFVARAGSTHDYLNIWIGRDRLCLLKWLGDEWVCMGGATKILRKYGFASVSAVAEATAKFRAGLAPPPKTQPK